MNGRGNGKTMLSFAIVMAIALALPACVKRAPRNKATATKTVTKGERKNRCGLLCKRKKKLADKKKNNQRHISAYPSKRGGKGVYHTVKKGENLWRICHTYGADIKEVARLNRINDVTSIRVGQKIWIPGASGVKNAPRAPSGTGGPETYRRRPPPSLPPRSQTQGTLSHPVPGGIVTSGFGPRDGRMHEGLDISAEPGTPVLAAKDGKVVYSDNAIHGYGNMIIIKHAGNLTTIYAHNRVNLVSAGDFVKKGEKIAEVGATGRATGPHLHFEVRLGEKPVDPQRYLP